jgi:hypothetical protein
MRGGDHEASDDVDVEQTLKRARASLPTTLSDDVTLFAPTAGADFPLMTKLGKLNLLQQLGKETEALSALGIQSLLFKK